MSVTVGYLSDNLLTNRGTIACTCKGCRDVSSGNKNSPHANQKKKEANGDRYEEYKRQYDKLKSSPNKTPEVKKQIEKLKRQMTMKCHKKRCAEVKYSAHLNGLLNQRF